MQPPDTGTLDDPLAANVRASTQEAEQRAKTVRTILMIDADSDNRDRTGRVIRNTSYAFLGAGSGEEGLELLLRFRPELVLLDYDLPGMNGVEVLQELAGNPYYKPVSETPVIMLASHQMGEANRTRLFQLGLRMFLEKPFAGRELLNVIENVFILHDLLQRNREHEQRIKRTEYKYQDLIENASDLIFTLNSRGEFVFINRRISALTGHLREAWKDRPLVEMVIPEDRATVETNFRNTLNGKSRIFEMRVRSQAGKLLYLSTNINPMFERGEVVGCVGIARDVTQRKKLEQEITELKNFNESIVQSIGSGLITLDLERKITSFNLAAEEALGWRASEVIGRYFDELFPAVEVDQMLSEPESDEAGSPLLHREMELTRKDSKRIHIGFTLTPRRDNRNRRVGVIISFRDISQIKQMQAEVLRMDRLASLGVLASGIAHEIRNPLAGIKTVAQTLEEDFDPNDGKREYVARIIRQVNRMDELLRTLFSYARPKSPMRQSCQLQEIVNEVKGLMHQRFDKGNIQFEEVYADDLPLIYVDFHQIQQVFLNLFLNALDAMPNGGRLALTARPLASAALRADGRGANLPAPPQGLYSEVRISDTGEGIPKENLQAIFDPFFTTKPQGSGLGLSIVYRIMEEHHGDIRVESAVGEGTTFSLLLPTA
ncbi:PAS domain S-box protein [bacterium]|nr:PAS domain S-box protein [bacterium]